MQLIDINLHTPEENLAFDEVMLLLAENNRIGETIRFWESEIYFVVLGVSGKWSQEIYYERCHKDNIGVFRRHSGGGTVLQGPGCLNYSLVFNYNRNKDYKDINKSYQSILNEIVRSFTELKILVTVQPVSDMVYNEKKFSGNAQLRKRNYFLHHGTILYNFDIDRITRYLPEPVCQPNYRQKRCHREFLTNICLSREEIKKVLLNVFDTKSTVSIVIDEFQENINYLVENKYSNPNWIYKGITVLPNLAA